MPIYDEDQLLSALGTKYTETPQKPSAPVDLEEEKPTGFLEAGRAFYQNEDPIYNLASKLFEDETDDVFDPNFRPLEKLEKERPELIDYIGNFVEVKNESQYNAIVEKIDKELENKRVFAGASTFTQITSGIVASVLDPLVLIPYAGIASKASKLKNIGRGAAVGLGLGAGTSITREAALQAVQETRTVTESAANIIAESTLGAIIGAAAGGLANPVKAASRKVMAKALKGEEFKIGISETGEVAVKRDLSAGAAERISEIEELGLAHINEKLAKIVSGPEGLRPPDLRAILSPSESVRKLGEVLYNSNYIRNKNIEGVASPIKAQNAIFRREQNVIKTLKEVDDLYLNYTGRGAIRSTIARPQGLISSREFSERVWKNLVDDVRVDEIAQVNKASKILRKQMDEMAKELQAAKLLPEDLDPKFMRNYMTRVYDLEKLNNPAVRGRFINRVGNWVKTHNKDGSVRTKVLDDDVAEMEADKILDKIRGESDQQIAMSSIAEGFVTKGKFLKERQLLIPDSEIAEFLNTDSVNLFKNYMARAAKLLETHKALERAGYSSIQDVIRGIRTEADRAVVGLTDSAEDLAKAAKLGKKFKNEEDLANMMYRSMLGQLRKPGKADRYVETLLNYQFVRLLGGVTVSSLPELVMVPFRQGFLKTLRDGYVPMLRSLKTSKLSKNQLNDLSGALEFEQANVLRSLAGIDDIDNIGRNKGVYDQAQQATVQTFIKATGIGYWTSIQRRIASQVASADIVRTLKKGVQGSDIERLAAIGIGKDDYARISAQIEKHAQHYKGTYVLNPHLWDDTEALEIMQNAIQTQVESAILKPGVESLPFFVQQNQFAKVMFQFKSFMSAATGKITISGLQRRDANVLTGLMALVAMGTMSGMAHDIVAGRDVSDDPAELLLDGISRSGVLGLVGTTVIDTTKTFYSERTNRFGSKFVSSSLLGPSAGQIEEMVRAVQGIVDGDVKDREVKAVGRMIPFMNLFYIKALIERTFDEK